MIWIPARANIERVVQNQSLLTLAQRADQLQNEVSVLRGRIEVLENANDTLRKQQRDLYADLDKRLSAWQGAGRRRRVHLRAGSRRQRAPTRRPTTRPSTS